MPLAGWLQGLGAPMSKQDCLAVMKRISATRSRLLSVCPTASGSASAPFCSGLSSGAQIQAKLPQIQLPVFSGNTEEWHAWSHTFGSAIDSREDLMSDAKLQYLIMSISGEALRLVCESEATGASYTNVMRELWTCYEHHPTILKYYLQQFLDPWHTSE